jgi:hypothetical protein
MMMQECSFQPNLITRHSSTPFVNKNKFTNPIYMRVDELQKAKNERMQQLRIQNELDIQEENCFKPQINKRSEKIAQVKQMNEYASGSVTDRLYHDASTRLEKQARTTNNSVRAASVKPEDDSYTFKPAIGNTSKLLTD